MDADQPKLVKKPKLMNPTPSGQQTQFKNISAGVELHRIPVKFAPSPHKNENTMLVNAKEIPSQSSGASKKSTTSTETSDESQYVKFRKNKTFKKNVLKRLKQIGPDPDNFDEINKNSLDKINPSDISGEFSSDVSPPPSTTPTMTSPPFQHSSLSR